MHELLNGQIVDDQTFELEIELKEIEEVEKELSGLTVSEYEYSQKQWENIIKAPSLQLI